MLQRYRVCSLLFQDRHSRVFFGASSSVGPKCCARKHDWIHLAMDLILSSVKGEMPLTTRPLFRSSPKLEQSLIITYVRDLRSMRHVFITDAPIAHETWTSFLSVVFGRASQEKNERMLRIHRYYCSAELISMFINGRSGSTSTEHCVPRALLGLLKEVLGTSGMIC